VVHSRFACCSSFAAYTTSGCICYLISFIQLAHAVQIQIGFHCDGRTLDLNAICPTLGLERGWPGLTLAERVKKVGARAREESVVWQQGGQEGR
jgi:hypothetical protein